MEVVLVEDDILLGKSIQRGLSEVGHACFWVTQGQRLFEIMPASQCDVLILDLMLPDTPGLEILKRLKASGDPPPVIVLTALGTVDERVAGLKAGADDYLVKPFAFAELVARLEVLHRRAAPVVTQLREGPLALDLRSRRVVREGQEIELTPTEFTLIEFLMRNANRVVTRRMLCEHLWEADWEGVTNVIEVHINRLRAKIDRRFDSPLIHTVRGMGYVFRTE